MHEAYETDDDTAAAERFCGGFLRGEGERRDTAGQAKKESSSASGMLLYFDGGNSDKTYKEIELLCKKGILGSVKMILQLFKEMIKS